MAVKNDFEHRNCFGDGSKNQKEILGVSKDILLESILEQLVSK